ncbi:MAG: carbohydrate ABC transporter permease [Acidimicrobiia bacterium]
MSTRIRERVENRSKPAQIALTVATLIAVLAIMWLALVFVKDTQAPERFLIWFYDLIGFDSFADAIRERGLPSLTGKLVIAMVALAVGIAGIWALYIITNRIVDALPYSWRAKARAYVFVGPAMLLLTVFLLVPAVNTIYTSFTEDIVNFAETVPPELSGEANAIEIMAETEDGAEYSSTLIATDGLEIAFVDVISSTTGDDIGDAVLVRTGDTIRSFGLGNYKWAFTDPAMHIALRNNILWLLFGVSGAVIIGLVVAQLMDKIRRESLAKTFIFLPMAISFVGAAVIWRFVYWWRPPGTPQIGMLNAFWVWLGNEPVAWMQSVPINTFGLILIMVWLQTGFAMVILSASIKGVPNELLEAARIDGASEFTLFFKIIIPSISPTVITVSTTIFIAILKVFDIVFVMTGGKFETEVIANRMFSEMFKFRNFGRASSLAVILLIVVIPIIVINVRNLREQGVGA